LMAVKMHLIQKMINQTRFLHDDEFKNLITKNGKVIYEKK
jgi:hypothetical protein